MVPIVDPAEHPASARGEDWARLGVRARPPLKRCDQSLSPREGEHRGADIGVRQTPHVRPGPLPDFQTRCNACARAGAVAGHAQAPNPVHSHPQWWNTRPVATQDGGRGLRFKGARGKMGG